MKDNDFTFLDKDDPDRSVSNRGKQQRGYKAEDYVVCNKCGAESYTQSVDDICMVCEEGKMGMPVKFSDLSMEERREIEDDMKGDAAYDEEKGK